MSKPSEEVWPPLLNDEAALASVVNLLSAIDPELLSSNTMDLILADATRLVERFDVLPLRLLRAFTARIAELDKANSEPE